MRSDHDVGLAVRDRGKHLALTGGRVQARQRIHPHGIVGQAVAEGSGVLHHEHGGGSQHRHLFPILHALERGAHRDFGLAVAGVPADQPVHDPGRLHVPFHVLDGAALVGRILVQEGGLHLALPAGVGGKGVSGACLAGGVQFEQLGGHAVDGGLRLPLDGLPALAADAVQPRGGVVRVRAHPALHLVQQVNGDAQDLVAVVDDHQRLDRFAADRHTLQPAEAADAVLQVHDVVARRELREAFQRGRSA